MSIAATRSPMTSTGTSTPTMMAVLGEDFEDLDVGVWVGVGEEKVEEEVGEEDDGVKVAKASIVIESYI